VFGETMTKADNAACVGVMVAILTCLIIAMGIFIYTHPITTPHNPVFAVTVLDKASYVVSQGFFSSRTGFFIITNKGTFEVGETKSGGAYTLWSSLEKGKKYYLDINGNLIIGAEEVT
jgi:hypothetical protein